MLETQDDYYDGLDQAARESQQAQQTHDNALVQDEQAEQGTAEEDKNAAPGTREAVAQELDSSLSGQAARLLVDNWLANDDAETVHEQIDGVDDSQWDAEMKQRLHEYVDAPVQENVESEKAQGETVDEAPSSDRDKKIHAALGDKYSLSKELADNGERFVQNEEGRTNLATIAPEIFNRLGIREVPLRLTESMAWHVFSRHKKEYCCPVKSFGGQQKLGLVSH